MQVGCYSLDLYCGSDYSSGTNDGIHEHGEFPHQYTGPNGRDCKKQARADGWKLTRRGSEGEDLCPKCATSGTRRSS